jgi:uncharacterized repeat protein (TIGR01451 family)
MTGVFSRHYNKLIFSLIFTLFVGFGVTALLPAHQATADQVNCDHNDVICGGANTSADLINKYEQGDGVNSAVSIQHIYSYFGISSPDIQALSASTPSGSVDSNGDVYLNGQLIAASATTAGRDNMTNSCGSSKNVSDQGTSFYTRAPCVSFSSSPLSAFVVMKNGVFQYAILKSCGNPVMATPKSTPQPSYTITKQVALKGSSNFSQNLSVMAGDQVTYKVTVQNTGQADITGLNVSDNLPSGVSYVAGSLERDGANISNNGFFSSGYSVGTLKAGASTVFSFDATVGSSDASASSCQTQKLNNSANMTATSLPSETSLATVQEKCKAQPPAPVVACTGLTDSAVSREAYNFTARASAQNSIIKSYSFNFGDSSATQSVTSADTSATTEHQYNTPGSYTATVNVTFSGVNTPISSQTCQQTIDIAPAPTAECTNLVVNTDSTDQRQITANVSYAASNGASLQSIAYDFGDSQTDTDTTATTVSHTYAQDGDYTVQATLTFSGNDTVAPSTCQTTVSVISAQPTCNLLQVSAPDSNGNVTLTNFQTTDDGAEFTGADIDWGDGTINTSVSPVIGQAHQYAMPAAGTSVTYVVIATANFNVDNQDQTATSNGCQQQITLTSAAPTITPTTPSTPTSSLVNTGSGSVFGVFSLATGVGIWLYRRHLRKHLLKNLP